MWLRRHGSGREPGGPSRPRDQSWHAFELSPLSGANIDTIRYDERIRMLPPPPRSGSGRRIYDSTHLRTLVFIRRAREFGFSLDEIRHKAGEVIHPDIGNDVAFWTVARPVRQEQNRLHDSEWISVKRDLNAQLDFDDIGLTKSAWICESVTIADHKVLVTPVFQAYWRFAAERQEIFFRRLQSANSALTNDPVLSTYRFTNSYRASDRASQYLIRNVIYRDDLPSDEVNIAFRILLFKLFNKIETWEELEQRLGPLTWDSYRFSDYDRVLSAQRTAGERIYSAAYIMPSGGSAFGNNVKHQNHLRLLEFLVKKDYPARLANCRNMAEAFALLRTVPTLGPFLAYQYATDINYSTLTNFSEGDFVVAGPGALDGIEKCFVAGKSLNSADVIRYMCDNQERHFAELGIDFKTLWGRRLQLIDCQNVFCEISKYARVAFPQIAGSAGRTRIKQKFAQRGELPTPWYPPKWNINAAIVA